MPRVVSFVLSVRDFNCAEPQYSVAHSVALFENLAHRVGSERIVFDVHHRVVEVRVEGLAERLDLLDSVLFKNRLQLAVDEPVSFGALVSAVRFVRRRSLERVDHRKQLL